MFAEAYLYRHRIAAPKSSASLQTLQVIDQRLHFSRLDLYRRHMRPRLDVLRICNPARKIPLRVRKCAGSYRFAASEVGQVRTNLRTRVRSANRMAENAGTLREYRLTTLSILIRWLNSGLKLPVHPGGELIGRLRDHPEGHVSVL